MNKKIYFILFLLLAIAGNCAAMQLDGSGQPEGSRAFSAGQALVAFASRGGASGDDGDTDVERAGGEHAQEGMSFDPQEVCACGVFCCSVVVGGIVFAITHGAS